MNYLASAALSCFAIIAAYMVNSQMLHWYLLPVSVCGLILGADAVSWFREQIGPFDIRGLIGIFGFHFFFLAPIIFVAGDLRPGYADTPNDWRYWIGLMGAINAVSIVLYRLFEHLGNQGERKTKKTWNFSGHRSTFVLICGIATALLAQLYVMVHFGGLSGITVAQFGGDSAVFAGLGIPRMIANSAPLLCLFGLLMFMRLNLSCKRSTLAGLILLVSFSCAQFVLSGLFSSRGLVVTSVIWGAIVFHFFWRPINAKVILIMLVPSIFMLWVYSFYKDLGPQVINYLGEQDAVQQLEKRTGRSFIGTLIGDFSRVDVHAYMLYRLVAAPERYELRYGRTYLEDFFPIIPYWIWRNKPANSGKVLAGTELLWGKNFYKENARFRKSTRAYGLAGETMLNFGPYAVPLSYAAWGFLVGRFRKYMRSIPHGDLRLLIVPYFIWFIPNMMAWDVDNWLAHFMIRAFFPILLVWMLSVKVPITPTDNTKSNKNFVRMKPVNYMMS